MKVIKQRNPYLKRISSSIPRKYSYDLQTGKYLLHNGDGLDIEINKTGTLKPKYKHYFSGFANHKQRYKEALNQPAFMHYVPDMAYDKAKSYYNPMTDKFAGYAQFPYKMKKQFPDHLDKAGEWTNAAKSAILMRKCQSEQKKYIKSEKKKNSIVLQHSMTTFLNSEQKDKYFNMSFTQITESKPLPKKIKRTCYNYKCKHMKNFVFDEKNKLQQSTKYSSNSFTNTLGRSFYETTIREQNQESKLIQQFS